MKPLKERDFNATQRTKDKGAVRSSLNVFLIVSYFVNGYNNAADADLRAIKQKSQKAFSYSDSNKTITINGNAYRVPNGWPEREKYFNSAMGIFS